MRKLFIALALSGAVVLTAPMPLAAHHGAATFDTVGEITLKGTVTEWLWANPHCILRLEVKAEDGTVKNWNVATSNVADSSKRGWSRRSFSPGDAVTVTIQPAKSGAPVGMIRLAVLADGKELK